MNDLISSPDGNLIAGDSYHTRAGYLEEYEAVRTRFKYISSQLSKITVLEALDKWIPTLSHYTGVSYRASFKRLEELQIIIVNCNLMQFSMINHEVVIDAIKNYEPWAEATRQLRAAAYVSFTTFLERQTAGVIKKAKIKSAGVNKTFFKVNDKVKTRALSKRQTKIFLQALDQINPKYGLIAKIILQGGKRVGEVASLPVKNVDFLKNRISFIQSKTGGTKQVTVINYPNRVMRQLRANIGDRKGDDFVFVSVVGKQLKGDVIGDYFAKAGKKARIPFRVAPHVLRVTLITRLKELRVQDTDIMKITGHRNIKQLMDYDKSEAGENATLHYNFV